MPPGARQQKALPGFPGGIPERGPPSQRPPENLRIGKDRGLALPLRAMPRAGGDYAGQAPINLWRRLMGWIIMGGFIALVIVVVGGKIPQTQQYWRWPLAAGVFAVFLALSAFRMVPAGHVGVKVLFGKVLGSITEGLHLVNPLISLERLSVRTQEMFEPSSSLSKAGR